MTDLVIILAVILTAILIIVGLYMVKTQVIINDKAYDSMVWSINCLVMALPIVIATVKALNLSCGTAIIVILTGILAICEMIVNKSKSNYKVRTEDGDCDYEEISSDDPDEILDDLTVLEVPDGSDNDCE